MPRVIAAPTDVIPAPTDVIPAPIDVIAAPTDVIPAPIDALPAPIDVLPAKAGIQQRTTGFRVKPGMTGSEGFLWFIWLSAQMVIEPTLAALRGDTPCLILTGGRSPSTNALDAAGATGAAVLLSPVDTVKTVAALDAIHETSRFQGQRKLDPMAELLEDTPLFDALAL